MMKPYQSYENIHLTVEHSEGTRAEQSKVIYIA